MNPDDQNPLPKIVEYIQKGSSGVIVLPANPTLDAVAAATALYLGLTKMSKSVSVACESPVKYQLSGVEKIGSELTASGDNLVISFPYKDGSIDKVDYNIQGSFFNLIVSPRPGNPKIDSSEVRYTYTGGSFDFMIIVDAPSLQSLGKLYANKPDTFQGKTIINIDRHLINSYYGLANFVNKTSSSTSELALSVLQELQVEIDRDMATNLYAGISTATNNFSSYSTNADTFQTAALLLKAGAIKKQIQRPVSPMSANPMSGSLNSFPVSRPFIAPQQPQPAPRILQPITFGAEKLARSMDVMEQEPAVDTDDAGASPNQTPQDWLKPKIFRGGGLI